MGARRAGLFAMNRHKLDQQASLFGLCGLGGGGEVAAQAIFLFTNCAIEWPVPGHYDTE